MIEVPRRRLIVSITGLYRVMVWPHTLLRSVTVISCCSIYYVRVTFIWPRFDTIIPNIAYVIRRDNFRWAAHATCLGWRRDKQLRLSTVVYRVYRRSRLSRRTLWCYCYQSI